MCQLPVFMLIFIIGFIGFITNTTADDSMDSYGKHKTWELKTNSFSSDDIRCYCNLPRCVSTGYMCRTARQLGGCFSELTDGIEPTTTRHGCIELLQIENRDLRCNYLPRKSARQTSISSAIYNIQVQCCYEHMCNHVDRPDHKNHQLNATKYGSDFYKLTMWPPMASVDVSEQYPVIPSPEFNSNEIWFRAATIAVPICGVVILLVLVILAIKLLKTDAIESPSKLMGVIGSGGNGTVSGTRNVVMEEYGTHAQNLKQLPLLQRNSVEYFNNQNVTHSELKNECLAKKNQLMTLEYSLLPQSCHDSKQTNTDSGSASLYRNVNLSTSPSSRDKNYCDSKVYEKEVLNPTPYWAGN